MLKTAEDIRQLNEKIAHAGQFTDKLREEIGHVIIGQSHMLDRLLIGLLSNGHVLLEGVPGLAKTLTISRWRRRFTRNSAGYSLRRTSYRRM